MCHGEGGPPQAGWDSSRDMHRPMRSPRPEASGECARDDGQGGVDGLALIVTEMPNLFVEHPAIEARGMVSFVC